MPRSTGVTLRRAVGAGGAPNRRALGAVEGFAETMVHPSHAPEPPGVGLVKTHITEPHPEFPVQRAQGGA